MAALQLLWFEHSKSDGIVGKRLTYQRPHKQSQVEAH